MAPRLERLERIEELEKEIELLKGALIEARRIALLDPLTEALNCRGLKDEVVRELARAKRQNAPLAVLFIDVDRFKSINDTHGHDVGDVVLKEVAFFLKEVVRASDIVARPGGDEFVVILPASNLLVANRVANKVNRKITNMNFSCKKIHVSLSVGVASTSEGVCDFDELKRLAGKRMYEEKKVSKTH